MTYITINNEPEGKQYSFINQYEPGGVLYSGGGCNGDCDCNCDN